MLTKLTLTIDQEVVKQAKNYAHIKNRSISRIVEEYLKNLALKKEASISLNDLHAPITESISGMFQDNGGSYKEMLTEALEEKFL